MLHNTRPCRDERGFTLIELMIVVAVIGIIAGVTIPGFVQGRAAAHESAVIGTMRAIATAEFKFKMMALVDTDHSGSYEFGTVRELTGSAPLRGSGGERLSPNLLPMSLDGVDDQGRFMKHGYFFALYLPDAGGVGVADTPGSDANIDGPMAENYWSLVAWPARKLQTGSATYFVNQLGDVVKSRSAPYSGLTQIPPAGAALVGTGDPNRIDANAVAMDGPGADGYDWAPIR